MESMSVILERVIGREGEYVIKDRLGITTGRVFIVEHNPQNRHYVIRIAFYKMNSYNLLKDALFILLKKIFTATATYKVNILVDEDINIKALTDLGFYLEGIIEDSIVAAGDFKSELILGITVKEFESNQRINIFRLKGNNIELKVLTPDESEIMLEYYIRNKEHLKPYEPARDESFYSADTQKKILMENYKQYLNGTSLSCGIYIDNLLIGRVQLSNIVMGVFRNAFVGYSIDKQYQGRGFMKEALNLIISYAFNDMELHRIEASTLVDNIRSQAVLEACGFKELGISKSYLFINGAWRDHKIFYNVNNKV